MAYVNVDRIVWSRNLTFSPFMNAKPPCFLAPTMMRMKDLVVSLSGVGVRIASSPLRRALLTDPAK